MSWKMVKLGSVLKQYRIEHIVQDNVDYKQVTISKHDGVCFRGYKSGKNIGRKRQFIVDLKQYPNTLMFVRQGVQDGSIGIAPNEVDGCIATENMPMFSINGIELNFLRILLKSSLFRSEVAKIATTGSAQKSIHERQILEIKIPLPTQEEQIEFVDSITALENKKGEISSELSHQLDLVKQLRQSFLREAMQGKLVAQHPEDGNAKDLLEQIKAEKAKSGKKEKPLPPINDEEIPFDIPDNWMWGRLGEIAELITSGSRDWAKYYSNTGAVFVRMGNLSKDSFNLRMSHIQHVNPPKNGEGNRTRLEQNDILISITGEVGNLGLIPVDFGEAYINQHTALVRLQKINVVKLYCYFFLSDILQEQFNAPQRGMKNSFRLSDIENLIIPLPPLTEQHRIVEKLDQLMQHCDELEASIRASQSQNEMLLQQVLREALRG